MRFLPLQDELRSEGSTDRFGLWDTRSFGWNAGAGGSKNVSGGIRCRNRLQEIRFVSVNDCKQESAQPVLRTDHNQSRPDDRWKHVADRSVMMLGPITDD
ncbi:MAG: hypothetical protein WA624_01140 [Methylocella sp.]